ncbi:hypothetical protein RUM44_011025 [Polyplax serrata]|uniref:MYND-type domain-containing protein n=1 Tax=Polyplax serrata TaxID=468196 RepID=A0ABR1APJ0_POLSC
MGESDKVFYGNMCFVCRRTVKEGNLKKCSCCKLIFYCSEAHQKVHWKQHSSLCRVIREIDSVLKPDNVENDSDWYGYRTKFLVLCELKMSRKLMPSEINMILFPNNCQICHKKTNLMACANCLCVNYCSEAHKQADMICHSKICHLFQLCCELDLALEKGPLYPDYSFRKEYFGLEDSMVDFIKTNIVPKRVSSFTEIQVNALIAELITCPLSLLFATKIINYEFKENTVLHVVGCSYLETASLKGPDVKEADDIGPCCLCQDKLNITFVRNLYHDYVKSSVYQEPDIMCTFNCGYHEYENSDSDTWYKTLPLLICNKNVPLIFTSFTEDEANRDMNRLVSLQSSLRVNILKNKFSGLRPFRDLEKLGVYFNNGYMGTVLNDS